MQPEKLFIPSAQQIGQKKGISVLRKNFEFKKQRREKLFTFPTG